MYDKTIYGIVAFALFAIVILIATGDIVL